MPNKPRILIVEDDDIQNFIYRELFKRYDCHVDVVDSADTALEKFNHNHYHYDLLLVDVRLPKIDGFELTRRIRATEKGKSVPIIGMSATTFCFIEAEFKGSGMDKFLGKPLMVAAETDALLKSYGIELK